MSATAATQEILQTFEAKRENLLAILHAVNDTAGYIDQEAMQEIADFLNISPTEVYGTTTFYSFFNVREKGRYIIRLCRSVSCHLAGNEDIVKALEVELGIKMGETTTDKMFTLEYTNCMGMCDIGPSMLVNNNVHNHLTPAKAKKILHDYCKGGCSDE